MLRINVCPMAFQNYISELNFKSFLSIFDALSKSSLRLFCFCKLYNFDITQIFLRTDSLSIQFLNFFFFSLIILIPVTLLEYVLQSCKRILHSMQAIRNGLGKTIINFCW